MRGYDELVDIIRGYEVLRLPLVALVLLLLVVSGGRLRALRVMRVRE